MLAIGLVVDDAIIVVEAVEHHIDEGMDPKDATEQAMEEVGGPVVAIALILAAVFIPTAAIPGITGRLYQQFAVTIAISVLISAFNALTLSPALACIASEAQEGGTKEESAAAEDSALFNRFFGRDDGQLRRHIVACAHSQVRDLQCSGLSGSPLMAVYLGKQPARRIHSH